MKKYADLIDQTFDFPTREFKVRNNQLFFHNVDLKEVVEKYGTPLRLSYLPKIQDNIRFAQQIFEQAIEKLSYEGIYKYAYCTKSSHFRFVLEEALACGSQIETSSAFDISLIKSLHKSGSLTKDHLIICNGFKRPLYLSNVANLINDGFRNCMPILDTLNELNSYDGQINQPYKIGIRLAADEEPNFGFYTSRLGIRYDDVLDLYKNRIENHPHAKLKMLHYFINTGIKDTAYYWSELSRFIEMYCSLKKLCPDLDSVDIGGGFPIKTSLAFDYDYEYMAEEIVRNIKEICDKYNVPVPNIVTEFGSYTVGESGATIYSVLDEKLQNDKELWYMMNGSFITHMPDVWGTNQKYILLPINLWDNEFHKVNIGGLTCDSLDYYDSEMHIAEVFLPVKKEKEDLYFGFFHNGAYQESLGGYGGIQHCLIPAPKHVILKKDKNGEIQSELFAEEQTSESMMKILGYE
ncbi:MAG: arginine decarboxylase [Cytophagales bacterium]|nr:arginine decarboxylase [Cytophagales bacterium]